MKQKDFQTYVIADVAFCLHTDYEIVGSEAFLPFLKEKTDVEHFLYEVLFQKEEILPKFEDKPIAEDLRFVVYRTKDGYVYQYFHVGKSPYAITTINKNKNTIIIQYLNSALKHITHLRDMFFHIRWEELMLEQSRLILHACCVDTNFGGILFSGISGIGKSTQGDLWCTQERARLINGDRPILYQSDEGWYACGSPYAGSSQCYVNEQTKIRAIVMLAQSRTCSIRRLERSEAFRKMYPQLTVSSWNAESIHRACSLLEQLIEKIPVYEMACTPDKEAVDLLKQTILKEV